jgi:hypothetical protein
VFSEFVHAGQQKLDKRNRIRCLTSVLERERNI